MATFEKYLLTNCNRFFTSVGNTNFLTPIKWTKTGKQLYTAEITSYIDGDVFPDIGLVLFDNSILEELKIELDVDGRVTELFPTYITNISGERGVVYASKEDDTILFYDGSWYVRFDGIPQKPSNELLTDNEDNEYILGVPYLRCGGTLPTLLSSDVQEISCSNNLDVDDRDKECYLYIDTRKVGYYYKQSRASIEGIYEGKLAYEGKRFRVGWGVWKDLDDSWYIETDDDAGKIQIQGITFADSKYYIGTKDDPTGWWEFSGTIEFEKDITFTFVLPQNSQEEAKENITLTWYGFCIYNKDDKPIKSIKKYVCESPTWR